MIEAKSRDPFRFSAGLSVAFAVTVLVSLLPWFIYSESALGSAKGVVTAVCAATYLVLGVAECLLLDSDSPKWQLVIYFSIQLLLAIEISVGTHLRGMVVLALLPLVAQAVAALPGRLAAVMTTLLYTVVLVVVPGAGQARRDWFWAALSVLGAFLFVIVFTRIAVREKQARAEAERLHDELRKANAQLREQAARIEEFARTRERNRLAREIHDSLGHFLTTIAVQLEAAQALHARDPERALACVTRAHAQTREALVEVRRSVGALRADVEEARPLPARLRELIASEADFQVKLMVLGEPRPLGADVEHGLYRAVQEGLTNTRKHAKASEVEITLDYGDRVRVKVAVLDNGCGCVQLQTGFGLTGLSERVALLGGTCSARSRKEGGFCLSVEVPA